MEFMELAEAGKVGTLIVKDHSRLGRNRLVVGQLLEEEFDRMGVRYIAIMDNIDSAKGLSDFLPVQDWFNEMHAKNTSQKVRAVFRSKGESGVPLSTTPPYGYLKNPEDKAKWIVDEEAAEVVRKVFDLCMQGFGPTQIADRLTAEGIPTPAEHFNALGYCFPSQPTVPAGGYRPPSPICWSGRNTRATPSIFALPQSPSKTKRRSTARKRIGKSSPTPIPPSLTVPHLSRFRSSVKTSVDRPVRGSKACFPAWCSAPTAVKNSISVRRKTSDRSRTSSPARPHERPRANVPLISSAMSIYRKRCLKVCAACSGM